MQNNYNPDVLSCLANLSSDEVFTPPKLANEILDLLPEELWKDKNATFLDPVSKSGVFLREIAKRLLEGLKDEIPDLQKRIDHIYTKQIFGIGITELTSLLSRRSVYCTKEANHEKYAICTEFNDKQGNIFFDETKHHWKNGRCSFCGASQSEYEREEGLETHAYQFIHNNLPDKIKNMKFDVIIGNPPYQISDGGHGASALPIYQKFVEQAKKLNPRFLTMVIPSRWFTGGRGLDEFRSEMLNDDRLRIIHDYLNSSDCFPGVEIKGGICYFLWDRDHRGQCSVYTHKNNNQISSSTRPLLEKGMDVFIRNSEQISILKKVKSLKEESFASFVTANDPFGFDVRQENSYKRVKPIFSKKPFNQSIKLYYYGWQKEGLGYVDKKYIRKGQDLINKWKVYISKAYGAGEEYPHQILNKPFLGEKGSVCTETYTLIGPFKTKDEANNVISYIKTRFFRFIVFTLKNTQSASQKVYSLVPMQDFSEPWTDEKLYKKYNLTKEEIEFIESMIRPMN